jgi:hypothetical protein
MKRLLGFVRRVSHCALTSSVFLLIFNFSMQGKEEGEEEKEEEEDEEEEEEVAMTSRCALTCTSSMFLPNSTSLWVVAAT